MSLASAANTAIPLCLGKLIDVVDPQTNPTQSQADAHSRAAASTWPSSVAPTSCVK